MDLNVDYNAVITKQSHSGEAFQLFLQAKQKGIRLKPATYHHILCIFSRDHENQGLKADRVYDEMKQKAIRLQYRNYDEMLKIHSRVGNLARVRTLCQDMKSESASDFKLNSEQEDKVVGHLMTTVLNLKVNAVSIAVLKELGHDPDYLKSDEFHKKYNLMFRHAIREGTAEDVQQFYTLSQTTALKTDVVTYNHLLSHFAKKHDFINAVQLYQKMIAAKIDPDAETFHAFFRASAEVGDSAINQAIYREMQKRRISLDETMQKTCWKTVKQEWIKETDPTLDSQCRECYRTAKKVDSVTRYALTQGFKEMQKNRMAGSNTLSQYPQAIALWNETDALVRNWANQRVHLTLDHILKINAKLGGNGQLRTTFNVYAGGEEEYVYAPPAKVAKEMDNFMRWLDKSIALCDAGKGNPIVTAARAAQRIVSIHPFQNENGRTSRMVMDYILQRYGLPPAAVGMDMCFGMFSFAVNGQNPSKTTESVLKGVQNSYRLLGIAA